MRQRKFVVRLLMTLLGHLTLLTSLPRLRSSGWTPGEEGERQDRERSENLGPMFWLCAPE